MTRFPSLKSRKLPAGHVLVPAAAISGLSLALAAGLEILGVHRRTNEAIASMVSRGGAEGFPNQVPDWCLWLAAVPLAFGLSAAILGSPGAWRRAVLWITAVVLVAAWAPVLSLASFQPAISTPWIATVWSGVCALVYAANHRMAIDQPTAETHETR